MAPEITNKKKKRHFPEVPKWIKISLIVLGSLLIILTIGWFVLSAYVKIHKKQLLTQITEKISENISGNLQIKDMEPALLQSFPDISVRLVDVSLEDSLYALHHTKTLELNAVYVKLNLFSLFSHHPKIKKITLKTGEINFFTLQSGFSNLYLFESKKKKTKKSTEVNHFSLEDVTFTYHHYPHNKEFKITLNELEARIKPSGDILDIYTTLDAHIHQLGFNLSKGGYLRNRNIDGKLNIVFIKKTKILNIPSQQLKVDNIPVILKASFNFGEKPAAFNLDLEAVSIPFKAGANMLSANIAQKLNKISVRDNISAHALIKGTFQYPDTPFVHVYIQVKNNTVNTPYGEFKNATFAPEFDNYIVPGKGRNDDNSGILVNHFKGTWFGIPVNADSTLIYGLKHPLLKTYIYSSFPVERLNDIVGNSFSLSKGNANFQITYKGPVTPRDTFQRYLFGFFTLKDAGITYLPRNLKFQHCNATLIFKGEDLYLQNVRLSSQKSTLLISGVAKKFLNAYFNDPSKAIFDWKVSSNLIDLNEFKSFLSPRKKYELSQKEKNRKISKFNHQLDLVLAKSTMKLDVKLQKVIYRRFSADHILANIMLQENDVKLSDVRLNHAGGTILANGSVHQQEKGNPFRLNGKINNVKVDQLFYAFENFGQNSLDAKNIEGSFSADVSISGGLQENAKIIKNSLAGKVHFTLENGELNNFPPFLSISKFIFKKRNLDHITFKTLSDDLDIQNGKVTIYPMKIESSAIHMEIEGVYALDKGTDISMKIPLRNPEKDKKRERFGLKPKKDKGIIVYLRAKAGSDGKVHISWDPLKNRRTADSIPQTDEE